MSMFSLQKLWMAASSEHRSSVFLFIIVMGGCLCFLAMTNDSRLENTIVSDAMSHGPTTRIACVASISLAIPVFANLFVDFYVDHVVVVAKKTTTQSISSNSKDILTKPEKLIFMLGIVIPPIVACFSGWNKATLLFACAIAMQQQFVFSVMMMSLNRFDANYFPTLFAYAMIILETAAAIVRSYAINACAEMSLTVCQNLPLQLFQWWVSWIPGVAFFSLMAFWLSSVLVARVYGEKVKSQYYRWPSWCCLGNHVQTMKSAINTRNNVSSGGPIDDGLLFLNPFPHYLP